MKNFEKIISCAIEKEITFKGKDALRSKLFNAYLPVLSSENNFKSAISGIKLSVNTRVLMKEKILMFVYSSKKSFLINFVNNQLVRRSFGFSVLFIFMLGLILQPFSTIETVKAYTPAKIATYSGSVVVERKGEMLRVSNDFIILENDIVQTGPNAFVEIVFADDSVVRLNNNSKVSMATLDNKIVNSNTEIDLVSGELWVNTYGLAGNQAMFKVNSGELATFVKDNAVFDIEVNDSFARVVALENDVNLELYTNGSYIPTSLKKGELVKVKKETQLNTLLDQYEFEDKLSDFNLDWIASNYKQDQFYTEALAENRIINLEAKAGITSDSYFYPIKEFQRAAKLVMTFDPLKQAELELYYTNQKLFEAEVLLDKGDTENAKKTLDKYSLNLTKVAKKVSDLDANLTPENKEGVQKLKEDLIASVSIQKKSLSEVLPIEDKYEFKQVVNQAEILVAETPTEKKKVELVQLNETLEEAKLLAQNNNKELAAEILNRYLTEIERISSDFAKLDEVSKSKVMLSIIESNLDGIAALESIKVDNVVTSTALAKEPVLDVTVDANITTEFDLKLAKVTEVSKENLNDNLVQAVQLKSPIVVQQVNKLNTAVDLTEAVKSIPSVIKLDGVTIQNDLLLKEPSLKDASTTIIQTLK
jgi:hypothetical protein